MPSLSLALADSVIRPRRNSEPLLGLSNETDGGVASEKTTKVAPAVLEPPPAPASVAVTFSGYEPSAVPEPAATDQVAVAEAPGARFTDAGENPPLKPAGSEFARPIALLAQVEPFLFVTVTPYCLVVPGAPVCEIGATEIDGADGVHAGVSIVTTTVAPAPLIEVGVMLIPFALSVNTAPAPSVAST